MRSILTQLSTGDQFNVVTFANETSRWRDAMVPATVDNVNSAKQFVDSIQANGGTNLDGALTSSLSLLPQPSAGTVGMVVLMTDGQPTVGVTDAASIVRNARSAVNTVVHCVAFGDDAVYALLRAIAADHAGVARKVYADADAQVQLEGFVDEVSTPVIANAGVTYVDEAANVNSLVMSNSGGVSHSGTYCRIIR